MWYLVKPKQLRGGAFIQRMRFLSWFPREYKVQRVYRCVIAHRGSIYAIKIKGDHTKFEKDNSDIIDIILRAPELYLEEYKWIEEVRIG